MSAVEIHGLRLEISSGREKRRHSPRIVSIRLISRADNG